MTASSLGKFLIPATLTAGVFFSALTTPLALFSSEPINFQFQGETFDGKLKDLAVPYLGLAGVLSLGAGIASLALTGWRRSAQQSSKIEQQLLDVQQQLRNKETQLQASLLSDQRLDASGLSFFLQDGAPLEVPTAAIAQPLAAVKSAIHQPAPIPQAVQSAVSPLSAAQSFLSFSRPSAPVQASWTPVTPTQDGVAIAQISELQTQLQQILSQTETLQRRLMATPQTASNLMTGGESSSTAP
ncbi:MAG: hypothetical protein LH702_05850 [Phormidesmis sp. CAN_BIN44]|nr:hypothetical protein [Phormidesmis sp. CAN_BIN44]